MADKNPSAVGDARFQKVHNDPRFARLSNKKNKLKIDKRFAGVLNDDKFQSVQGKYDKYGRRIDKKSNELKKFYHLDEDDKAEASDNDSDSDSEDDALPAAKGKAKAKSEPTSSSDDDNDNEDATAGGDDKMTRLDYLNRMARGELESGSDTSDDSADSDADAYIEEDEEDEKEDIPMGDETKRFAVMNCDWSRIRAVDLFALFQSFTPATGAVKDVTIYPSEFGLEKMKEEEQFGPRGLWSDKKKKKEEDEEGEKEGSDDDAEVADDQDLDDEEDEEEVDPEDPLGVRKTVTAADEDGFDVEKLRKYELQKLKYYYAVVTCDSVKTAAAIYENCDQLEYETSSNLLDLRFIPDDMVFTNDAKESCHGVPETYKPAIFATMALQNTDVKLTWEDDDDRRVELLTRQSEWKDANDDDFSAYLASDNSSSEDDAGHSENDESDGGAVDEKKRAAKFKKLKNRYRKMLLGSDAEDSDDGSGASSGDDSADEKPEGMDSDSEDEEPVAGEGEMEMSFTPGAGDVLRAKRQKELEASETPFERYIREKKLEKNKKRHEKRAKQKEQQRETKAVLTKKGKAAPEELEALRAAIDDNNEEGDGRSDDEEGDRNFDMKKIAQSEKISKLKGKRKVKELKKLQAKKSGLQEGFAFDAVDPRFSAIYQKGSQFQLDPTDPKFKKTEATQAIFQERRKRNAQPTAPTSALSAAQQPSAKKGSDLKAMVENLKRKAAAPVAKSAAKPFKKAKK